MSDHKKMLERAMIAVMANREAVFFSSLVLSFEHKWDEKAPTAYTNGLVVCYNPNFFASLTKEQQVFLLLHEVMHIALMHVNKARSEGKNHRRWNAACDYAINLLLVNAGFVMPEGGLLDKKFEGWSEEKIYDYLEENSMNPTPDHDDLSGEGESGSSEGLTPEEIQQVNEVLTRAVTEAHMANNDPGKIPGSIQFYLESLISPKLPWINILKNTCASFAKEDYSFSRPNRRYLTDFVMPSLHSEHFGEIMIATDTSGSVTDAAFAKFIGEASGVIKSLKPTQLRFVQFDHDLQAEDVVRSVNELKGITFKGRGGTCMRPVFKRIEEVKPKAVIVFTDGYFDMPKLPKGVTKNFVWVIYDNPSFKAPVGKLINYDNV